MLRRHDGIRQALQPMLDSGVEVLGAEPPAVLVSGDLALVLSRATMGATAPDGTQVQQSGTATDVMRRQPDGTWRYVIDNPAGIELR